MRLYAISDLHLDHPANLAAFESMRSMPEDGLVLAGDIAESMALLERAFRKLSSEWARLWWVPGNHELWTKPSDGLRGEARYGALVEMCRRNGVSCPEDELFRWPGSSPPLVIVPLFLLYDYSFAPDGMSADAARQWAADKDIQCVDEWLLDPTPYQGIDDWCRARCRQTRRRLDALEPGTRTVLVNHFAFHRTDVHIPRIPRFIPWCGTRETEDWHRRYRAEVLVHGHLHVPRTHERDGVRIEEVSFGYPRERRGRDDGAMEPRRIW